MSYELNDFFLSVEAVEAVEADEGKPVRFII